ncbi:MAG: nucleotidyltransferase domain-containing protein [Natronosporangium sp.]
MSQPTLREPTLRESTGDPVADQIVRGVTGVFTQAFPDRIRGCYLRGSYATGTRAAGSDLDLFVVFADRFPDDRVEVRRAWAVARSCALISPILLEIIVVSEQQLHRPDNHALALNLKHATRLLHGQDIRPDLPELQPEAYLRAVIDTPSANYAFPVQRRDSPVLTYPLRHLDPEGPFFGFDQWQVPGPDGTDVPSSKLLVGTVGWTATAIVVLQTGRYVRDKRACVDLYREHIADQWTDLVAGVHELCRDRWHYLIPAAEPDRRRLRALCDRALEFQNHFLRRYREFLLAELRPVAASDRQLWAARRLGTLQFPDQQVVGALQQLRTAEDQEVRAAAAAALGTYPPGALDMRGGAT